MKNKLLSLLSIFAFSMCAFSQATPNDLGNHALYTWAPVSPNAAIPYSLPYLILATNTLVPPAVWGIDEYTTGTQPTDCNFQIDASPDGVVWTNAQTSLGTPTCNADVGPVVYRAVESFVGAPRFIRITVTSLGGADATTTLHFFYSAAK